MSSANVDQDEFLYPASDGQPMAETQEHILLMVALIAGLRHYFKDRRDIYAIGNMFLYYREGDPTARRAPDIMVVKGVDASVRRRSFKTWVEKALPAVTIELTSKETAKEDQEVKLQLYEKLGIQEYFLFDPLNEYLPRQLMGFRLVKGNYQELQPDDEDALLSEELGLRLVPQGTDLALIDIKTGQPLLDLEEMHAIVEEMKQREVEAAEEFLQMQQAFQQAQQRAERNKQLADQERELKQQATERAEQERQRAEQASELAEQERQRAEQASELAEQERQRAEQARELAEQEKQRADQQQQRADQQQERADALAAEVARLQAQLKKPPD